MGNSADPLGKVCARSLNLQPCFFFVESSQFLMSSSVATYFMA